MTERRTTVCIAGGGPAGLMLGLLLARAGIAVIVLEKHRDFLRDFRGDTIHPSTMDLLEQLGLTGAVDEIEHTAVRTLDAVIHGVRITPVDFGALQGGQGRLRFMPQWDLLNMLAEAARQEPNFTLLFQTTATGLLRDGEQVVGVEALSDGIPVTIRADLTVAAEGRASVLRKASGLTVKSYGVPIDVLWFRLGRPVVNPPPTIAYLSKDGVVVTVPRAGYYQVALLIEKNSWYRVREGGLPAFHSAVARTAPFLADEVKTVQTWDDVQLLSVQIDRLQKWHLPGFLAIGDAAHAMSPAFGVGINYAIQDAVAAANLLTAPTDQRKLDRDGSVGCSAPPPSRDPEDAIPAARSSRIRRSTRRRRARPAESAAGADGSGSRASDPRPTRAVGRARVPP